MSARTILSRAALLSARSLTTPLVRPLTFNTTATFAARTTLLPNITTNTRNFSATMSTGVHNLTT